MKLQTVIRELLVTNRFVSLPRLGSFSVVHHPAKLSATKTTFFPPYEEYLFDQNRVFNDEVLERHIAEKMQMPFTEASKYVENAVEELIQKLNKGNSVDFEGIGTLKTNTQGMVTLHQYKKNHCVGASFGLETLEVFPKEGVPITSEKPVMPFASKSTNMQEKPKNWLIVAIAAVAVLVLLIGGVFLLVPELPTQIQQPTPNLANAEQIKPSDEPHPPNSVATIPDTTSFKNNTNQPINKPHKIPQPKTAEVEKEVEATTNKRAALFYQEPKAADSKMFYVISGSFENDENAQTHARELKSKGHTPEIIKSNGRYRVAVVKFSDRGRASRELDKLKREEGNADFWLLGQ